MYLQSFCYADQYSKARQMCAGTLNCGSILLNDVNTTGHHTIIGPASIPNSMMQKLYIIISLSPGPFSQLINVAHLNQYLRHWNADSERP